MGAMKQQFYWAREIRREGGRGKGNGCSVVVCCRFPPPMVGCWPDKQFEERGRELVLEEEMGGTNTEVFLGSGKIYHGDLKGKWGFIKFNN